MPPFEHHPEDALHLIQYRPHHNCVRVAEFVGYDPDEPGVCDCEDEEGAIDFGIPDGRVLPGDFICKRPDGTFEVVTADDLLDYIKGTTGTWLEA